MTNKWVRSVSFNKTNSKDVARLKLIGKKSFSKFVKKLLDEEIERQSKPIIPKPKPIEKPKEKKPVNPMLRRR